MKIFIQAAVIALVLLQINKMFASGKSLVLTQSQMVQNQIQEQIEPEATHPPVQLEFKIQLETYNYACAFQRCAKTVDHYGVASGCLVKNGTGEEFTFNFDYETLLECNDHADCQDALAYKCTNYVQPLDL